jgi:hypothetical protein
MIPKKTKNPVDAQWFRGTWDLVEWSSQSQEEKLIRSTPPGVEDGISKTHRLVWSPVAATSQH